MSNYFSMSHDPVRIEEPTYAERHKATKTVYWFLMGRSAIPKEVIKALLVLIPKLQIMMSGEIDVDNDTAL